MSEEPLREKLSEQFLEDWSPDDAQVLSMLDGSVQSQGLAVSHRDWLDMGSESWGDTPDNVKAAAYQAAHLTGWDDARLRQIMLHAYTHLTDHLMDTTMECLRGLAMKFPLHVEADSEKPVEVEIRRGLQQVKEIRDEDADAEQAEAK